MILNCWIPRLPAPRLLVVLGLLVISSASSAQEIRPDNKDEETKAADTTEKPVLGPPQFEEAVPIIYFKDKNGNLIPLINFTMKDIDRIAQQKALGQEDHKPPRFSVRNIAITGQVVQQKDPQRFVAELTIVFKVRIDRDDWVRVPLRFQPAYYRGAPQRKDQYVHRGKEGLFWMIRAKAGSEHQLPVNVKVPVTIVGGEHRLKLNIPRGTKPTSLKLIVPAQDIEAKDADGVAIEQKALGGGKTELTLAELDGDVELTWRARRQPDRRTKIAFEVKGELLVRIDSQNVNTEATLTVSKFGQKFKSFRVQLPPGAQLVESLNHGFEAVEIGQPPAKKSPKAKSMIEVSRLLNSAKEMKVRILTKHVHEAARGKGRLELAGFNVPGAGRQYGHIALHVDGPWRLRWDKDRQPVQLAAADLPPSLRGEAFVAGFEYFAQPFVLSVDIDQRVARKSVEPVYVVYVDADKLRLKAAFNFTVSGTNALNLEVKLPGWELDENSVGPANLVNLSQVKKKEKTKDHWIFPLTQAKGKIPLVLRATRKIEPGAKKIDFTLPQPINALGPLSLEVVPADNVVLSPQVDQMTDLRQQLKTTPTKRANHQQESLLYRSESDQAKFISDFQVREQEIRVDVLSVVHIDSQAGRVEQSLTYQVDFEPVSTLSFELARSILDSGELKFEIVGGKQPTEVHFDIDKQAGSDERARVKLLLPKAYIGKFELSAHYPLPVEKLVPQASYRLTVPLIIPINGRLASNVLEVPSKPGIKANRLEGPWTLDEAILVSPSQRRGLRLKAKEWKLEAELEVTREDQQGDWTVIERAWVQTWLDVNGRVDRAVYRFTSNQSEFQLTLPPGAQHEQVEVFLDGNRKSSRISPKGELTIELPDHSAQRPHVLELRYQVEKPVSAWGRMSIETPTFPNSTEVRRTYWQFILPSDEHVIVPPANATREFVWGWQGVFWGRIALLEQDRLESWSGAKAWTALPGRTNRYLFSTLGPTGTLQVRTASRSLLVLICSSAVLLGGLLLIYVRATRHPGVLFGIAVVLFGFSILFPAPAVLAAQAAALGTVLALMAGLLERTLASRRDLKRTMSDSSIFEHASTEFFDQSLDSPSQESTATVPIPVQISAPESES